MAVLLTRPRADSARIAAALAPEIPCLIWPLTEVHARPAGDPAPGVEALLFTSANAVTAFAAGTARRDLPALCVGDRTAQVARAEGFVQVDSAEGTAEDLAALALASGHAHLLYLRGETVSVDLAGLLAARGRTVDEAVVYAMGPGGPPPPEVDAAARSGGIALVTVWSAASAAALAARLADLDWPTGVSDLLAISAKAAAPLAEAGFRLVQVAETPDAPSMLQAIRRAAGQKNG